MEHEELLAYKIGVNKATLDFLWELTADRLVKHYEERHRQREPALSPFASLIVALYYLRHYPPDTCLALELAATRASVTEARDHALLALFESFVPTVFGDSLIPTPPADTGPLPGVHLVVDSTFLVLPHIGDFTESKKYYHFKSGTKQALKWQLCVDLQGVPVRLSDVVPGSTADLTLLRSHSGLLPLLPAGTRVLADKAYVGEPKLATPKKKPRGGKLKEEEKKESRLMNSKRAVVENCIHEFKKWAILGGEWRGEFREEKDREKVTRIVHIVGALVRRHLAAHPLRPPPALAL